MTTNELNLLKVIIELLEEEDQFNTNQALILKLLKTLQEKEVSK